MVWFCSVNAGYLKVAWGGRQFDIYWGGGNSTKGRREIFYQKYIYISIYFGSALLEGGEQPPYSLVPASEQNVNMACYNLFPVTARLLGN